MVLRNIAKIIVAGAEAVGKALSRAIQEEIQAAKHSARRDAPSTSTESAKAERDRLRNAESLNARLGISLQESVQILDVKQPLDPVEVQNKYEHLFAINEKKNGGTLYIQSKVYRAKERIDAEFEKMAEEVEHKSQEESSSKQNFN